MSRRYRWIAALALAQAGLLGAFWWVERERAADSVPALGSLPPEHIDLSLPALNVQRRRGSDERLRAPRRPTLLHVWASWCPPCRAELPGLLALPEHYDIEVIALSVDKTWAQVDTLRAARQDPRILLAQAREVTLGLGVRELPTTFLLDGSGKLTLRFNGARDWTDRAFVERYLRPR